MSCLDRLTTDLFCSSDGTEHSQVKALNTMDHIRSDQITSQQIREKFRRKFNTVKLILSFLHVPPLFSSNYSYLHATCSS